MTQDQAKLIACLRYALAFISQGKWSEEQISLFASDAMDAGLYCESFRVMFLERRSEHITSDLDQDLIELGESPDLSEEYVGRVLVSHGFRNIVQGHSDSIETLHRLLIIEGLAELWNDRVVLNLRSITDRYYTWWADDSERMVGARLDAEREQTRQDLVRLCHDWLAAHEIANPLD